MEMTECIICSQHAESKFTASATLIASLVIKKVLFVTIMAMLQIKLTFLGEAVGVEGRLPTSQDCG